MPPLLTLTLLIISAFVLYAILKIPVKRLLLVSKLKSICQKRGFDITVNHVFKSMLKRENEPDIIIKTESGGFRVFILTTRFHRVRYHFPNEEYFEIMGKVFILFPGTRLPVHNGMPKNKSTFQYEYYKKKYDNFDLSDDGSGLTTVLLVHPIPFEISIVKNTETVHLWNGDEFYNGILFYSGDGFKELLKRK
ncbi:MAG: hypothetical protein IKB51_06755 [Clostridia bacterium]|nr:hypothetical protein [Clostridia bacterium]